MKIVKKMTDGLQNLVSGLGTSKSKREHSRFVLENITTNWMEMDAAYQTNWIARRICDIPAEDMTREWRTIKCRKAEEIEAEEMRLGLKYSCLEALSWSRLHGGAAILMMTNQDLGKPLNVNAIKKGGLEKLLVFDRWEIGATTINNVNPLSDNYLLPEFYTVTGGGQQIHWSHFARFTGARLPRRLMQHTQGWGDSELRKCLMDIKDVVSAKDGISELMQEANIDIIQREGLNDELASDQDDAIKARYELYSQMKSIVNMALLDSTEQFTRNTLSLSGVAPVLDNLMIWLAGCANMPATKLFGMSPAGLNATGEGDLGNYYDSISAGQGYQLAKPLSHIDQAMVRSALGAMPDDFDYKWNPLKKDDVLVTSQAQLVDAQRNRIYIEDNIISSEQVRKTLQSNEVYQFDDDGDIDEFIREGVKQPRVGLSSRIYAPKDNL